MTFKYIFARKSSSERTFAFNITVSLVILTFPVLPIERSAETFSHAIISFLSRDMSTILAFRSGFTVMF